ncbi:MAG TPA: glycoside hydrolase family 76 protein [Verrucomicrobiae bacterium]|nr:glycoside hydrolase family 76 protein [Verrucomicrobiae bacterium]
MEKTRKKRMNFSPLGILASGPGIFGIFFGLIFFNGNSSFAFTPSDVVTSSFSFRNVFYTSSGGNAWFKDNQSGGATYFWGQANEIECVIDAYEWTSNSTYKTMITSLLNGFEANNGSDWSWNVYNDDVMWACMAFARGYLQTGNTTFRDIAKSNFDMCYARGWDNALGGMYWTTGNTNKVAAVNGPASIAAYLLYQSYGDAGYLTKAQTIFDWERSMFFVPTTGMIYDGMRTNGPPGGAPTTYNQGTFIGAANFLGRTNDAILAADYTMNHMTSSGILPQYGTNNNNSGFNAIFIRWMARFMKERGLQSRYQQWLQDNANASWNFRRTTDNLSWCQWRQQTPRGVNLDSWDCIASFEIMQAVPPTQSSAPGTVTLNSSDAAGNSSFSTGENWSDGNAPSWTNNYLVNTLELRTPADATFHYFYGSSLILTNGGALRLTTSSGAIITVGTLLAMDNGIVSAWSRPAVLNGRITLKSGGGVFDPQSFGGFTITAPIDGPGTLTVATDNKTFGGTVTLASYNSYSGGTIINGPFTLQLASPGALGSINGSLTFENNGDGLTIPHATYTTSSYGTLNLNGFDASIGNLDGEGGRIANNVASGTVVLTIGNGNAGGGDYAGIIADHTSGGGVIALVKTGSGKITLSGKNTYSGGTTISGGTLQLGDASNTGVVFGDIVNNTQLVFANPDTQTFAGKISGNGAFTKSGAGTLILTAANTYAGGTTVSEGTLQLGDGAVRNGTVNGNIQNNSVLAIANPQPQTITGSIGGSGALVKTGAGTLTFSGANTYTGETLIKSGTLALSGSGAVGNSASVSISSGANLDVTGLANQTFTVNAFQTLTGGGSVNGNVSASAGSAIKPGDAIGAMTIQGNATLNGLLYMEINRTNAQTSDRLICLGDIAANGTLVVTNLGPALQPGDVFQLFNKPVNGFKMITLPDVAPNIWSNNLATDGTIRVVAPVATDPTKITMQISPGALSLSWPADHIGWRLQSQTNAWNAGLGTNWSDLPGTDATNHFTLPTDFSNGSVFFRLVYP